MKKFFKEHGWWLSLIPIALIILLIIGVYVGGIIDFFRKVWEFSNKSIGMTILNVLLIPFAILGGVNLFRGFFTILETDAENLEIQKYWQFVVYFVMNVVGYFALFYFYSKVN